MEVLHGSSDAIRLFSSFQNQDEDHLIVAGPSGEHPSSCVVSFIIYPSDDVQGRYPFGMLQEVTVLRRMKVFMRKRPLILRMFPTATTVSLKFLCFDHIWSELLQIKP